MKSKNFKTSFHAFLASAPVVSIGEEDRIVFFSDLHIGDGGTHDDLVHNRNLVETVLEKWYLDRDYSLVLNGDIEDLNKFSYKEILRAWPRLFDCFNAFSQKDSLFKIVGNHDLGLLVQKDYSYELLHNLILDFHGKRILAFHGHQASRFFHKYDYLSEFIVRYIAKPLRLKNTSIDGNSRRKFVAEGRIYNAALDNGLIAITGHTHRPLFESFSKYDSLRWSIERLFEEYAAADADQRIVLAALITMYKWELERLNRRELQQGVSRGIYGQGPFIVPCLFNSGCGTGKHGITAIEIERGAISLVHWAENDKVRPYIWKETMNRDVLPNKDLTRFTLRAEKLDLVFAKIELLGRNQAPLRNHS